MRPRSADSTGGQSEIISHQSNHQQSLRCRSHQQNCDTPGTIAAHSISPLASQNQAVTPGHTCLALNTCSNTYTLMQANPPVSLSALWSEWLITNLTPGDLEACAHLRSLRGLLLRESDRREMEKWNCQPGCNADTLGANRMKLLGGCTHKVCYCDICAAFQGKMS